MNKRKMIAIDIDGTLTPKFSYTIPKSTINIIKEAKKYAYITIVTGRMYSSSILFALILDIDIPIITYQGAYIVNPKTGEFLSKSLLDTQIAEKVIKFVIDRGFDINIFSENTVYSVKDNKRVRDYSSNFKVSFYIRNDIIEILKRDSIKPVKLQIIDTDERIANLEKEVREVFPEVGILKSFSNFLEIVDKSVSKSNALAFLLNKYKIKRENLIAIGDSYNDVDMLDFAGFGIAMEEAPQELKDVASYIAPSVYKKGIEYVIEKFVLNKENI